MTRRNILFSVAVSLMCVQATASSLNDPTRPPTRAIAKTTASGVIGSTAAGSRLTAILFSAERRVAVIDGKAVREGDQIAGATVTHIQADSVTLLMAKRSETLRLPKAAISIKSDSITSDSIRSKSAIEGQP